MKTTTLFCLSLVFFTFSTQAQISKGSVLLGGNIGFSNSETSNNSNEYKNQSYNVSPSLGFVVKDNQVFGLNLSYSYGIFKSPVNQKSESTTYGAGIFHRRYLPLGKSFYLYGQGQLNADFTNQEQSSVSTVYKMTSNSVGVDLFPGVAYAISKKFHLEIGMSDLISLGYYSVKQHNTGLPDSRNSQLTFRVNANPASDLSLGFRILLGNK